MGYDRIKLREVESRDIVPAAEFLAREFPFSLAKGFPYTTKEFWLKYFELWWEKNPAYSDPFPRGWLLENETTIIGFIGNIPVKFLLNGEIQTAASANAWYVNPSVRGAFSVNLFKEFLKQKNPPIFLFKIEDESYVSFLSKFRFKHYVLPESQQEYIYLIDKRKVRFFFTEFLSRISWPSDSEEVTEILKRSGMLLSAYLYQKPLTDRSNPKRDEYISSVCSSCDNSFSELWDPYLKSCNVSIARDTKTLNWLYFSSSRFRKRIVIQCRRSGDNNLAGYMVFDVHRIKATDEATLQLMDICIGDHDPAVLASLISCARVVGKENGASMLFLWADDAQTENYLRNTITMRITSRHHRFIRFQDTHEKILESKNFDNVRLPMIHPPQ